MTNVTERRKICAGRLVLFASEDFPCHHVPPSQCTWFEIAVALFVFRADREGARPHRGLLRPSLVSSAGRAVIGRWGVVIFLRWPVSARRIITGWSNRAGESTIPATLRNCSVTAGSDSAA